MSSSSAAGRATVAVIGAGVSGLTAAYLLDRTHDVRLYEADDRLGGHAHTHTIREPGGRELAIDSGFIVHNGRTYPWLRKLFGELGVAVRPTEMSMSVRCEGCGLEYAGGRGVRGILAQPRRAADPQFLHLLRQVRRFHRLAADHLRDTGDGDHTAYGEFLERHGFSDHFVAHFAVPVVSCVWSSGHQAALDYPARYLFEFLDHHGMLTVTGSPTWYTVVGGSRSYVERIGARLSDVRTGAGATDVTRHDDGVDVRDTTGTVRRHDKVVVATHADQALALLTDPTDAETDVLKQFTYSRNETVLHTDASILPAAGQARASWNYVMASCANRHDATVVSYWMNRLQGLDTDTPYLVTLNATERLDPDRRLAVMDYSHPVYTPESVAAQQHLPGLANASTAFAGAYHGWGFHEDGCRSGVEAARHFGVQW